MSGWPRQGRKSEVSLRPQSQWGDTDWNHAHHLGAPALAGRDGDRKPRDISEPTEPTLSSSSHSSNTTSATWAGATRLHADPVSQGHLPYARSARSASEWNVVWVLTPRPAHPRGRTHGEVTRLPPGPADARAARRRAATPGLTLRFPLVRCLFFPPMVVVAAVLSGCGAEVGTAGPQLPVPRAGRGLIVTTCARPPGLVASHFRSRLSVRTRTIHCLKRHRERHACVSGVNGNQ